LHTVPVLVVGGGPVGLVTALELQSRGIRTLLIERNPGTTRHPKMDVTNGRSMEHFRRLGIAELIRDAAVPRKNCMDVVWVTRLAEWELARFRYPDVHTWRARIKQYNDGSQPLEPNMRLSQVVLEPVLRELLELSPLVELRFGWTCESVEQNADGVTATIRNIETNEVEQVQCQLLAGCDGGSSCVRQCLGVECAGTYSVLPFYMVHYRTPARELMRRHGIAWHYQSPVGGTLIAQDDDETFTLHNIVPPGSDPRAIDPKSFLFESLGMEFPCEILKANPWSPHLVVAGSYGRGRIWMAGDSVHQFIPTGGYGMNTGVCDGVDLAWKFAAVLQCWGGPNLLTSIDAERRPVAMTNCEASEAHMAIRIQIAAEYTPLIHQNSAAGATAREALGRRILELGNHENESLGIELGYRYRGSPIVCNESGEPPWSKLHYVPSTWPGVRAPHVFLEDGTAIFDRFGRWFTLLNFGRADPAALVAAARARQVPLTVVNIEDPHARSIYERDLVLIRPDQHVGWRGNTVPRDALSIIDRVRGA